MTDIQPDPSAWPACGECGVAYVLRRVMRYDTNPPKMFMDWVWQQDCKHRKAAAVVVDASGVVPS